jgi:hypothetical protein
MRTPSLYSQDDPISAALKPSPTETEAERDARLLSEAEARRVSEQIDEDLRNERERMKRNRGDVKVGARLFCIFLPHMSVKFGFLQLLLLGQAESGKSTLQKQFQLMYRPNSIDQERISWKTVIYFNVVHSLKHILTTLEAWDDTLDDESENDDSTSISPNKHRPNGISEQPSPSTSLMNSSSLPSGSGASPARPGSSGSIPQHNLDNSKEPSSIQIGNLRRRLSPLVSSDAQLADRLSGGITVSGSGKGGVYVRSGWQARTIENALGRIKTKREEEAKKARESLSQDVAPDILVQDVGRMLSQSKGDIKELWGHPTVRGLIARRKLKLDEWSEL